MKWNSTKDILPQEKIFVMAKNPFSCSFSWINGKNELGKPRWFHVKWEHADDFVTHWRKLSDEELFEITEINFKRNYL